MHTRVAGVNVIVDSTCVTLLGNGLRSGESPAPVVAAAAVSADEILYRALTPNAAAAYAQISRRNADYGCSLRRHDDAMEMR